jgi:hypothetical protein
MAEAGLVVEILLGLTRVGVVDLLVSIVGFTLQVVLVQALEHTECLHTPIRKALCLICWWW